MLLMCPVNRHTLLAIPMITAGLLAGTVILLLILLPKSRSEFLLNPQPLCPVSFMKFFHCCFLYLISAVEMCLADEECLHLVTKQVYPQVARQYKTNWRAVERNMRKAGEIAWLRQQAYLEELARGPLKQRPSNAQLLAILTMARRLAGGERERPAG